jgi:hypothetical protein
MAAKTKELAEDEMMKARSKAKLKKDDDDEDDGEDMACSDGGKDDADADDDKGSKGKKKGKKLPWMKSKKKASKAADDDEDMDEDEDDDGDDDMDKSERYSVASLDKSLQYLRDKYETEDDDSRRDVLFAKAHSGAKMSKSERTELLGLIDGTTAAEPVESLAKSATDAFTDEVGDTVEISDFLTSHHEGLKKSLGMVGEEVDGLKKSMHEHNLYQAKVLVEMGELIKSLVENRAIEMEQPARAPKARGAVAKLEKSFGGQPQQEHVSPQLIKSALNDLAQLSHKEGRDGMSKSGYDFALAMAMYESARELPVQVAQEVKSYLRSQNEAG